MNRLVQVRRWRWQKPWSTTSRREGGQDLVEFAMVMMILLLIILGIVGFSLIFAAHLSLNLAANTAARAAAVTDWSLANSTANYDLPIYNELIGSMLMLTPANIQSITIYRTTATGGISSDYNLLDHNGNRTYQAYQPVERVSGTYIGVQVVYRQPVVVPLVSSITGDEMIITKSATFRIE